MVTIPRREDPVLLAIKANLEKEKSLEPRRTYLGASEIGEECSRKIWYNYNGYERAPMEWKGCMATNCGHRSEAVVADMLRKVDGIELHTGDWGFTEFDGKFKGHYDGVIKGLPIVPDKWHIWEAKDCNEKKFNEFRKLKDKLGEKNVLREWSFVYYIQAQMYMFYEELDRHYMTVSLSGVRDLDSCRTEYDEKVALAHVAKAKRIIDAKEPPTKLSEKPDFYKCRWCPFHEVCHA